MSTTAALSLLAFLALSYIVLRFVQRTKSHSQSYSDSGQWNPERTFEFVFDNHFRDEYYRLKNDGSQPNVLGPLLLRRTMVNIGHLMETQSKRQTIQSLVQAGSLSEDVWQTFSDAERFMNDEMQTIIEEAELMKTGWGKVIVRQAHELLQAEMAKQTAAQEAEADQISKQRAESDLKEREAAAAKAAKELLAEEEREGKKVK